MKTTNKLSKWCKSALMLSIVAAVLTFTSCEKDDGLSMTSTSGTGGSFTINFDNAQGFYAGPTSEGENCYESYDGGDPAHPRYYGYTDSLGVLYMGLNPDAYNPSEYNMWGGGICISEWNDTTINGWTNQCSVYYIDPNNSKGGYNGSNGFAFHYGYKDTSGYGVDARSFIRVTDSIQSCVFDHFYVTNNTYAVRSMEYGDEFSTRPLDYEHQDWFRLIIEGIKLNAPSVYDTVYLADFREEGVSPGILKEWQYKNLSSLGEVTALRFDMEGSLANDYGLTIPAYFCFDDLTIASFTRKPRIINR
jgi:hypothetical protein